MDSKAKIIAAAIEIFAEKGKHGAHMEEIASRAKINKAMPYYFFTTKDNLYREVLSHIFLKVHHDILEGVEAVARTTDDPVEILKAIVNSHFDAYADQMNYTKILLEGFAAEPLEVKKVIEQLKQNEEIKEKHGPEQMYKFLEAGVASGVFRNISPRQVLISIIGMNMVYFASRPISQTMLDGDFQDEKEFLKERKESIIDLLLYGIMNKNEIPS
jgi:AcrR family transcriptional regulator